MYHILKWPKKTSLWRALLTKDVKDVRKGSCRDLEEESKK